MELIARLETSPVKNTVKNTTLECTCEKYCLHKSNPIYKKEHKCCAVCDICSEKNFLRKSSTTLLSASSNSSLLSSSVSSLSDE